MISDIFGMHVFTPQVMARYLSDEQVRQVTAGGQISMETADAVAEAIKNWALELGATHFCHWFQPLTGTTAEKHESFLAGEHNGQALLQLTGKQLIRGESDASSFPSGGLRGTAYARGYTAWDTSSPAFIKEESAGKILCIPTIFVSNDGTALDMKTPLLRAMEALEQQGRRLTGLFGKPERVIPLVGPEQEYFLVDRAKYSRRRDLLYCGRTLFGAAAPKGQELDDQYFGAIGKRAGAFMQELNRALWKLGVMAAAQHNEVAPGQHELAVRHCVANVAVDQNQLIMETMKHLAPEHGLVCLLHEKPFAGVNGSGKHNNWSLCTESGENLLKPREDLRFLLVLACVIQAVDRHSDLLRMAAANAGNDARLGGQEAPTAVVSLYLGQRLQTMLEGAAGAQKQTMDPGIAAVPTFRHDGEDRNRTAAMAFTGNKFEFRMVGSSDSVAMANTVICTMMAQAFCQAADALEGVEDFPTACRDYVSKLWKDHKRIVFNGDCYSAAWAQEARRRGLPELPSMVDAVSALCSEKSRELFEQFQVFSRRELESRAEVLYEQYAKRMRIEARVMLHMVSKDYIPAVIRFVNGLDRSQPVQQPLHQRITQLLQQLSDQKNALEELTLRADALEAVSAVARCFRDQVVPAMERLRGTVDSLEMLVDRQCWPMPTYGDLMFEV